MRCKRKPAFACGNRRLAQALSLLLGVFGTAVFGACNLWRLPTQWEHLPPCLFHETTGYLCPTCGNTRAVLALLRGRLLESLGYNPMILTLFLALLCLYAELICYAVGKPRKILPRKLPVLVILLVLILGYDIILRNLFPAWTLCR